MKIKSRAFKTKDNGKYWARAYHNKLQSILIGLYVGFETLQGVRYRKVCGNTMF